MARNSDFPCSTWNEGDMKVKVFPQKLPLETKIKESLKQQLSFEILLGGTTYQTGLSIFPKNEEYVSLTSEKMAQLRSLYYDVHIMILDEMSMLGAGRLYDIHHRWQDIKISKDLFGAICTLLGK